MSGFYLRRSFIRLAAAAVAGEGLFIMPPGSGEAHHDRAGMR
jgi:hypothetical protein